MRIMRTHLVCLACRRAFKRGLGESMPCPSCQAPMVDAGEQLAVPARRDVDGWQALGVVLDAGLRFHPTCRCCGDGPGYRPRTMREVRERQEVAARTGRPVAEVLSQADPWGHDTELLVQQAQQRRPRPGQ